MSSTDDGVAAHRGLSTAEAGARLRATGPNVLASPRRHPVAAFGRRFVGPVPAMLELAFALEIALRHFSEAAIVAALLVVNAAVSTIQESRAQNALAALRRRLSVTARALRDGAWSTIPAAELVPGDVVHVRVGDLVPADLTVLDGDVEVDQSVLTGESVPTEATAKAALYAASIIRRGEATGSVTATGSRTFFGKTAELVRTAGRSSGIERLILSIVKYLVAIDTVLAAVVLLDAAARHARIADVLPFALMLLIASVPIALPATFTLATALGALEIAGDGVLVARLPAIEEAAAMDVLCTDKTGTLTTNELRVASVEPTGASSRNDLLAWAALACDPATQDPLDVAILRAADGVPRVSGASVSRMVPFDPHTKRAEALVRIGDEDVMVSKGAPQVLEASLAERPGTAAFDAMTARGERVLAVTLRRNGRAVHQGWIGFADPPRDDSASLIHSLRTQGVRVLMVTGDTVATARAVASTLGIGTRIGSREAIESGTDDWDGFAGVLPEDKFRLVQSLQRANHVVGMTGDGVNDAPALRQADVGVAVATAVDVAKSAASLVLTSPGLRGVLAAVTNGRRIYQRLLTYTLNKIVKTFEIALLLALGYVVTGTFVTTPRHILLLLLTNDFVTMSLSTDRAEGSQCPARWDVRAVVRSALVLALAWLGFSFGVFELARRVLALPLATAQTAVFVALVLSGQFTVYLVRERRAFWRSRPSGWMLGSTLADLVFVGCLSLGGILVAPMAPTLLVALLAATLAFALVLDRVKVRLFRAVEPATVRRRTSGAAV